MTLSEKLITAIIPVRLSTDFLYDEIARIERILSTLPDCFSALVVDYGTSIERSGEIRSLSLSSGVKVVRVESSGQPFSVGHARDIGAQHASTPLVMFHDIDFLLSKESYEKICLEARLKGMPDNAYAFFALPGAYLTEPFTREYLDLHASGDGAFADARVHNAVMTYDKGVFDQLTFAISAIVVNRLHLLAIGGHDKSFTGHGAEDFELMHRLSSYYPRGPRPRDYYNNTRSNSIAQYEGFRAYYALYGIDIFQRGTILSHLWHPRRADAGYVGTNNQARVAKIMRDFDGGVTSLPPLTDEASPEYTLMLIQPGTSPARALRHAFPAMGRFKCIPERSFETPDSLLDFVQSEGFTRVFFLNPYGNSHRLDLYRAVRAAGVRFVIFDRGSLNDSWFFDTTGFLGESASYSREKWDKDLSPEDKQFTEQWILNHRIANETLEKNGDRIGAEHLRQMLKTGDKKVIFVALQRPSDTATVYFSGQCGSASEFNQWIFHIAEKLDPRQYVVVAKKHPLESVRPPIGNVLFAEDDTHINDLIDLADKIVVMNSGAGLIAAAYGKPVICCGSSFYAHDGFAYGAENRDHLLSLLQQDLASDPETKLKFMKYLISEFYSFGKTEYLDKTEPDGSFRRIAKKTIFTDIRGLTPSPIKLGKLQRGVSLDAPLFYSFGGREGIVTKNISAVQPKAIAPAKAAPKPVAPAVAKPAIPATAPLPAPVAKSQSTLTQPPKAAVSPYIDAGRRAFHDKEYEAAAALFEEWAKDQPNTPEAHRSAAEAYASSGKLAEARKHILKAKALLPTNNNVQKRYDELNRGPMSRLISKQTPFDIPKP